MPVATLPEYVTPLTVEPVADASVLMRRPFVLSLMVLSEIMMLLTVTPESIDPLTSYIKERTANNNEEECVRLRYHVHLNKYFR